MSENRRGRLYSWRVVGAAVVVALAAVAAGVAGSKGNRPLDSAIDGRTLAIYSSVPWRGPYAQAAQAIVRGEMMALADVHSRIGRYRIAFESLDDSTVARGAWDPGQTTVNARRAAADPRTVGYLGEVDSGASAISIPVLNRAGVAQISAASGAVGLTSDGPGASPGEPQKYYPAGVRNFARVVPNDAVQAAVLISLAQGARCTRTFVLDDGELDGDDAATSFRLLAQADSLQIAGSQTFDPAATDYTPLASAVAQTQADCVMVGSTAGPGVAMLINQIASALPRVKIFASHGVAESSFADPALGGLPAALDPRVVIAAPALGANDYPPAGRAFLADYKRRFGAPPPFAIFGYEAMRLMLQAIYRASKRGRKPVERSKVLAAVFATRRRASALGVYSIDGSGDTTLRTYGVYRLRGGQLQFWKVMEG